MARKKNRLVVVVDRGWVFAGDATMMKDKYLRLGRAVHVFSWASCGFAKMVQGWRTERVDLRPCEPVEVPLDAVIFRIPVADDWGLK